MPKRIIRIDITTAKTGRLIEVSEMDAIVLGIINKEILW
jgi:hypothetical protein